MIVNDPVRDDVDAGSRGDEGACLLLPQEEIISIDETILVEVARINAIPSAANFSPMTSASRCSLA